MSEIAKRPYIAEKIVFLDGLTGSGKTMMGPILGSFKRVELGRLEHIYEYLCALRELDKIDPQAGAFMVSMYADLALYDTMISREINFRWTDLTSAFRNPRTFEYLKRLFYKDGNIVLDRIQRSRPILQLISHQALGIMNLAFNAFGDRLRVVEMVRHPLYLLEHWYSYIDRHGTDSRDFTIWIDFRGQALPWFAKGWEEKYALSNSMDKVIYSIEWLLERMDKTLRDIGARQNQVLIIPFENFVLDPQPYIEKMSVLLETQPASGMQRVLRQQKCPRLQVSAGPSKEIYKRYGWKKPSPRSTEREELDKKRLYAQRLASPKAMKALDAICKTHEERYGLWF